jgi:hypothetical protein
VIHTDEKENANENDRIRNRVDSDVHNDMVDTMEGEYILCRGWARGGAADCVTFYVFYIVFIYVLDC